MSIKTQIESLTASRNTIRTKLVTLGLATSNDKLSTLATAVSGIENRGAVSANVKEGETYTIPKGYHTGAGTVSGVKGGGNYSLQSKGGNAAIPTSFTETVHVSAEELSQDDDFTDPNVDGACSHVIYLSYPIASITSITWDSSNDAVPSETYVTPDGGFRVCGTVDDYDQDGCTCTVTYTTDSAKYGGIVPAKHAITVTPDSGYYGLSDVTVAPIPDIYQDVSGVTADAGDVLTGHSIIASDGSVKMGSMPNNGNVTKSLSTSTTSYTIPAGYHAGGGKVSITTETKAVTPTKSSQTVSPSSGKVLSAVTVNAIPAQYQDVTGVTVTAADVRDGKYYVAADGTKTEGTMPTVTQPTPSISVSNAGLITASATQSTSGYVASGTKSATKQLTTQGAKTVTPTKSSQTAVAKDVYTTGVVTVGAIPDAYQDVTSVTATAGDVLEGKKFVNASGTVVTGGLNQMGDVSKALTPLSPQLSIEETNSYDCVVKNGSTVTVATKDISVTPTKSAQKFSDGDGGNGDFFIGTVTVGAIPDAYQDVTGVTATAGQVLTGTKYVTADGTLTSGTMANQGAKTATLSTATTSYTIPAGYHNGSGKVSITTETKSVTPTKSAQDITPSSGKVLSKVSVAAIPAKYQDVSPVTAEAGDVLTGHSFVNSAGTVVAGTMADNSSASYSLDGLLHNSYVIPAGYHDGDSSVNLSDSIETALAAI